MNYIYMLDLIKVELNKQTEEIKQYIKDEYDRGYRDGYDHGYEKGYDIGRDVLYYEEQQ